MAAASADSSRLREIGNFSISTDENTNRHIVIDAGRSRKRKQTHTPRQEQEIGDCQFIEVVIPLGDCSGKTAESEEENNINVNVMMTPPALPLPASPESATTSPIDESRRTINLPSQEYHRNMPRRSKSKRRKRNFIPS